MLECVKSSIQAVSQDRLAFETQLRRVLPTLLPADRRELKRWLFLLYGECYFTLICQCFAELNAFL
jgi:hypothetical protein